MRPLESLLRALVVIAPVVLAPAAAWACPACALRDDGGVAAQVILGAMILLPFGIAGTVFGVMRKVDRDESAIEHGSSHGDPNA
jgi:hypothetical protein